MPGAKLSAASGHPFTVDLHLHTNRGSSDSNLKPAELVERARALGLGAIAITEHDNMWETAELGETAATAGLVVLHGMEVTTDWGHVGVFGLKRYVGGIYKLRELRRVADGEGALLIANHPFRYRLDARLSFMNGHREPLDPGSPERAAELELFQLVDAIEVLNGACSEEENLLALRVARTLGLAEVGGSDSHSSGSVGCAATLLSEPVRHERGLIEEIRARRCRAGRGLPRGALEVFALVGEDRD